MENSRRLASLAVFRELYESKRDIYGILSEFIKETIYSNGKYQFNIGEITHLVNTTYDFKIPEAVIKTTLGRLPAIKKEQGYYTVKNTEPQKPGNLSTAYQTQIKKNIEIIAALFNFIEKTPRVITISDKKKIETSFCQYLMDDTITDVFTNYVSAFLIANKNDKEFCDNLNNIKEGVILYSGITYNSSLNDLGSWNTDLSIYLETEILFSVSGFNGELYKTLANDFYSLVAEANTSSFNKLKRNRIQLKYFRETKDDIDEFFKKAEHIVAGDERLNPSKTAMCAIVDGCRGIGEVLTKKACFYQQLREKGIFLDDEKNYYDESNHVFNIEDKEIIAELGPQKDTYSENLRFLNYINILRKGKSKINFEDSSFILLTAKNSTKQLARHPSIKKTGEVPLATTLDFLTNRLWFKLNKGFGDENHFASFNAITKAQLILSAQTNNSISNKYETLKSEFKNGKISENQAKAVIIELRKEVKKPEEIDENNVEDVLRAISDNDIEDYIREQEIFKTNAEAKASENALLKQRISEYEEDGKTREKIIQDQEIELAELKKEKQEKDAKDKRMRVFIKNSLIIFGVCVTCVIGVWLIVIHDKIFGIILTAIGGVSAFLKVASFLKSVIKNKS